MNEDRIGSLVVTRGEQVVGIFSERDILRRVVAEEREPGSTKVWDIMTTPVAICRPDTPLDECKAIMTEKRVRHLPVVEDGKLKGIVTAGDVMAMEATHHQQTIEYLHEYLHGTGPEEKEGLGS
jgi:CBS domain-containing protein